MRVADDDLQQIVEVVSDATGHLTKRFHFLRLGELLLRPLERCLSRPSLGDVTRDFCETDGPTHLVANRFDHDARPERALDAPHTPPFGAIFALVCADVRSALRLPH